MMVTNKPIANLAGFNKDLIKSALLETDRDDMVRLFFYNFKANFSSLIPSCSANSLLLVFFVPANIFVYYLVKQMKHFKKVMFCVRRKLNCFLLLVFLMEFLNVKKNFSS